MVSVKRAIGKTPFPRALRFTVKTSHVSRLTNHVAPSFFELPAETRQKLSEQLSVAKSKNWASLSRLKTMQSVLGQAERYHGRKPTYSQAVAAIAMHRGLSGKELKAEVDALIALNLRAKNEKMPLLSDSNNAVSNVIKKGGLAKVTNALEKTGAPMSTSILAKRTGLTPREVNSALIMLESMRMATQLPKSGQQKTSSYSWIATEKRLSPKTKPVSNSGYLVLEALQAGPKSLMELFTPTQFFGRSVGTGKLSRGRLRTDIPTLEKQGLIRCESRKIRTANHPLRFYSLTALGQRLLKEQQERASIHPELRKMLIGQPFGGLMPKEARRLEKVLTYLRVRKEYAAAPRKKHVQRGTLRALMKKYNLTLPEINRIISGKSQPWRKVSFEALMHIYLPAMYKVSPAEARQFEKYLAENKSGLRRLKWFKKPGAFVSPLELFEKNQRLAFWTVEKFWPQGSYIFEKAGMTIDDIKQDALLELQKAADTFDQKSKNKFSTYAVTCIKNMLMNKEKELSRQKRQARIFSLNLESKNGEPAYAGIASKERPETVVPRKRKAFIRIIKGLKAGARSKELTIEYFGLRDGEPKALLEVAQKHGITHQAVHQAIGKILEKLRKNPKMQQFKGQL